jgi:hypothetical protein
MTVFYFDIQIGSEVRSIDEEGRNYSDVDAARIEAATIVCDLARDMIERKEIADMSVLVRDEFGELLVVKLEMQLRRLN